MDFKTKPYDHQKRVFELFKDRDYSALFLEMGTGKTKIAIDIASYLYLKHEIDGVLLIAPNGVHTQWVKEQLPEHSPIPYDSFIWDSGKYNSRHYQRMFRENFMDVNGQMKWLCANVEYFSTFAYWRLFEEYMKTFRTLLIIDESTRIKNPRAKRTKNILKLSLKAPRRMILTGTPVTNSPFDLWAMMEFLKKDFWECNYFVFQHRYGIFVKDINNYSGKVFHRIINEKDYAQIRARLLKGESIEKISLYTGVSEKNLEYMMNHPGFTGFKNIESLKQIVAPYAFYIKKEECLDLPPKIYEKIYVTMNPEQKGIYKKRVAVVLARYENVELSVQNKVSLTLRLLQVCGGFFPSPELKKPILIGKKNEKIEALKKDLEEIGDERIIIWAHFIAEIEELYTELTKEFPGWGIETYYGKTDKVKRQTLIEQFQVGNIKILICNQQTASFGLNLQRSNLHYFFSNTFSLEHRLQAEDRSHRAGQKWPVLYKDIIIKGSIEERVLTVLKNKKSLLDYFKTHTLKDFIVGEAGNT